MRPYYTALRRPAPFGQRSADDAMQQSWVIGTAESCDIRVASPYVSGRHCRLSRAGAAWTLEDLGSTNGTFVNGVRLVGVAPVSPQDRITLGTAQPLPWPEVADDRHPARPSAAGPRLVTLPAAGGPLLIGRAAACDVVLDLPMVSARHAVVERGADGWQIRDLGSTNGTFVDGRRITGPVAVPLGTTISLGSCPLTLVGSGARPQPARTAPAAIAATDLTVTIGGRALIRDVSLVVRAGELVAVMGPSGAGKSTLLAVLTGGQAPARGRVVVAGIDLATGFERLRGQIGHVPQDDIMHADLTVGQAVWYAARLRLPRDYRPAEISARVATVLEQLGIADVAHVRIGTPERRGISGGQRKRVNVAMELITDPPILILDEPTSGLSSTDALALVQLLRRLADGGKTIVLTMHQPGVEVLEMLDALVVIARDASTGAAGELVWYGPAWPDAARFFEPANPRPDAAAVLRGLAGRPVADWRAAYAASAAHRDWTAARRAPGGASTSPQPRRPPSFLDAAAQWRVLVRRMLAIRRADGWSTALVLLQAPLIALLVAAVFGGKTRLAVEHASWTDVCGALATTSFLAGLAAIWFGCSNAAREIVGERAVYRRERAVGLSRAAYLAAKVVVLAGLAAVQCGTLLAIVHGGCGLRAEPLRLFLTLWLAAGAATALGLCASAAVRSAEAANGILPLVILPMVILGGILLPLPELPGPTALLADAMPSRWAFEGVLVAEAAARPDIEMPDPDRPADAGATRVADMAEAWFPVAGWRGGRDTPAWMLAAFWSLGLATLWLLMARRDAADR